MNTCIRSARTEYRNRLPNEFVKCLLENADYGPLVGLLLGAGEAGADVLHRNQVPLRPRVPCTGHRLAIHSRLLAAVGGTVWVPGRRGVRWVGGSLELGRRRGVGVGGVTGALG